LGAAFTDQLVIVFTTWDGYISDAVVRFSFFLYKIPHFSETRGASHATTREPR